MGWGAHTFVGLAHALVLLASLAFGFPAFGQAGNTDSDTNDCRERCRLLHGGRELREGVTIEDCMADLCPGEGDHAGSDDEPRRSAPSGQMGLGGYLLMAALPIGIMAVILLFILPLRKRIVLRRHARLSVRANDEDLDKLAKIALDEIRQHFARERWKLVDEKGGADERPSAFDVMDSATNLYTVRCAAASEERIDITCSCDSLSASETDDGATPFMDAVRFVRFLLEVNSCVSGLAFVSGAAWRQRPGSEDSLDQPVSASVRAAIVIADLVQELPGG